jgi:NAD(P)H-dependent flavin oxidoreductase YrpB (nitropropane dioxygenase family)
MLRTKFTQLLDCTVPIQQAAMGALANPELAAAVANAGGLGMVSVSTRGFPVDKVREVFEQVRILTSGVFGANFILPLDESEKHQVEAAAKKARVVEFFYGWPDPSLVDLVHSQGALVSWQIGSTEEAIAAQKVGCDLIVAQGIEAGGHIRGTIALISLLCEVLGSVEVPVVAAGGIGTGRAMAAALAASASAVRVGTRFVAAKEAGAHPDYVKALIGKSAQDTIYTDKFSVGWPNAPHRVLRSCVEAAEAFHGDVVGEGTSIYTGEKWPILRFQTGVATKLTTGEIEAMGLWAGESVAGVKRIQSAAEIVQQLTDETEELLGRWAR